MGRSQVSELLHAQHAQAALKKTGNVIWSGVPSKTSVVEQRSVPGIVAAMSRKLCEAVGQPVTSLGDEVSRSTISSRERS